MRAEPPKDPPRLWRLDGKFYDLTDFIQKHPGGVYPLRQSMGLDITPMFHSHHMRGVPEVLLAKYRVHDPTPEDVAYIEPCDYTFDEGGFFQECKRRVQSLGLTDNARHVDHVYALNATCVFVAFLATWYAVCLTPLSTTVVALSLVNVRARITMTGIGHEAIHGRMQNWLTWEVFDMMMLFPSRTWHFEHVLQHHPHTKRHEYDPDEILDPFRLCEHAPWMLLHIFQVPLQMITLPFATVIACMDKHFICRVDMLKGLFYLLTLHLAPFFTRPAWSEAWLLFGLSVGIASTIIVLAFHVSHVNESNALHARFQSGGDWGAHQLLTSSNFNGTFSYFFYATGMLDMQIEHHIFPSLGYKMQRKIKPVVEQCARDFGLPYYEHASLWGGVASHLSFMHKLAWAPTAPISPASVAAAAAGCPAPDAHKKAQ